MSKEKRNETVDIVRGIAIILVMVGHVGAVNVTNYYSSLLANVIWSIQMPLFMLISGYCTKYSKPINSGEMLLAFLFKRTLTYLLPWFVWTIGVKGIMMSDMALIAYVHYILYNMDAGYWFLASLWMIVVIFSLASYISNKFCRPKILIIGCLCLSGAGAGILLIVGIFKGLSFLGIKLTVYYLPFFCLGYLFGQVENKYADTIWFNKAKQYCILPLLIVYLWIILNFDLYAAKDSMLNIAIRVIASVSGCALVISIVSNYHERSRTKAKSILLMFGIYSLEWYVVHTLFTSTIDIRPLPEFLSLTGFTIFSVDFILMLAFSWVIISIVNSNKWCRQIMFGKK